MRKVKGLLAAGADVSLVDPRLDLLDVPDPVEKIPREFTENDLDGAFLVFVATGRADVNRLVADTARRKGILANIADDPVDSDFTLPASFTAGALTVATATGGGSPAVAAMIRDELEKILPGEWPVFLEIAGKLRARLLTSGSRSAYNQQVLQNLVNAGVLAKIRSRDVEGIDRLLEENFGAGTSLAGLKVSLPKGSS